MKLSTEKKPTIVGGMQETAAFKVEMNAMLFHSIIDGIYADKISSPFRELCTNARDSHIENGNGDEPFDIQLPSAINPIFRVRDYGIGLSHDDVMGLYTTMFASTKRDSNQAVGMIGLGSKSPFAYTSAFTVTSIHEGIETVYSAYIGDEGVPQIAVMASKETNQRNGIEISMPVQQKDIQAFRNAANTVLFGFDPKPRIINESYVAPPAPVVFFADKDWTFYQSNVFFTKPMARQGCVLYPIDPAPLGVKVPTPDRYGRSTTTMNDPFWNWPLLLDFEIGELDVATSREALGYTTKTVANLKAKIEAVKQSMAAVLLKEVESCNSYVEACNIYYKANSVRGPMQEMWRSLGPSVTWKGTPLKMGFEFNEIVKDKWQVMKVEPNANPTSVINATISFKPKGLVTINLPPEAVMTSLIAVDDGSIKLPGGRLRRLMLHRTETKGIYPILWIKPQTNAALSEFINLFHGAPSVVNLKDVEPLSTNRKKGVKNIKRMRYLTATVQSNFAYDGARYTAVDWNQPALYIEQREKAFYPDGYIKGGKSLGNDIWQLHSLVTICIQQGIIPAGQQIVLKNSSMEDIDMKEFPNMLELKDLIKRELVKRTDLAEIAASSIVNDRNKRTGIAKSYMARIAEGLVGPKALTDFMMRLQSEADRKTTVSKDLFTFVQRFIGPELGAILKQSDKLYFEYDEWTNRYPLLETVVTHANKKYVNHYLELISK